MSRKLHIVHTLGVSAIALAFSVSAQAAASRTFVSTTGNDSNTAVNCSPSANCRTFGAALSVTNSGGEIVVLSSGGYGPATISQPVIITAIGVDASISVTMPGADGLTINTSGNVTLIGLNLHGEGTGHDGILVQQVGYLRLYNMLIENFTNNGVDMSISGNLEVFGSAINDNGNTGIQLSNTVAYVAASSFSHNAGGVGAGSGSRATVVDSEALHNVNVGFVTFSGNMTLFNSRSAFNDNGLVVNGSGTFVFANCLIANNVNSYNIISGTLAGTNPGTSFIAPGQSSVGALSTAVALQ